MGIVAFFAVVLMIGSVCKTEEATSGVANAIIIVPMAFLSGSSFLLDQAPEWIRSVSGFMPLKHMNDGVSAFLVNGHAPGAMVVPLLVLAGFTALTTLVAAKLFNWEAGRRWPARLAQVGLQRYCLTSRGSQG